VTWRTPYFRLVLLTVVATLAASQAGGISHMGAFLPALVVGLAAFASERGGAGESTWPALIWSAVFALASLGVVVVGIAGAARLEWIAVLLLGALVATARNLIAGALAGLMATASYLYVGLRFELASADDPILLGPALLLLSAGALMGVAQEEGDRSQSLQAELAELGENLRNVLASVASGVLVAQGEEMEVTTFNPTAVRILGVREEEVLGRPVAGGPLASLLPLLEATPSGIDQPKRQDQTFPRKDGVTVRIGSAASPLEDRAGKRLGTILVFQDVTLIRDYEERMLRQEKLAALGRLVSGIAHEFGNQLGGARGLLDLALLEDDLKEVHDSLQPVRETLTRSLTTVENLLRFGRGTPLQRQPGVDLGEVAQRALDLLRAQIEETGLGVEFERAEVPALELDPVQLEQVVLNLVINAIHATSDQDEPRLRLSLEERDEGVVFAAEDNGPGVPEEVRARIFEPFFTTKGALGGSETPGTGLGLSMALGVVEAHSGRLTIDVSPLLGGARFQLWLPSTNGDANRPRPSGG
jgi:PAS domain S-box-containing protein